ncbi:gtp binding protein, partial [Moniliophthora roreri]
ACLRTAHVTKILRIVREKARQHNFPSVRTRDWHFPGVYYYLRRAGKASVALWRPNESELMWMDPISGEAKLFCKGHSPSSTGGKDLSSLVLHIIRGLKQGNQPSYQPAAWV